MKKRNKTAFIDINQTVIFPFLIVIQFLASWILKYLIEGGYRVKGTVTSLKRSKVHHYTRLMEQYPNSLTFHEANPAIEWGIFWRLVIKMGP